MRDMCIIDEAGRYIDYALEDDSGVLQYYALRDGEQTVETLPPIFKGNAGTSGLVSPVWDGSAWTEGATDEEIAAFDAANPAPVFPSADTEETADMRSALELLGVTANG